MVEQEIENKELRLRALERAGIGFLLGGPIGALMGENGTYSQISRQKLNEETNRNYIK